MEPCRFFLQGRCAFGTACRFRHAAPAGAAPAARRPRQQEPAAPPPWPEQNDQFQEHLERCGVQPVASYTWGGEAEAASPPQAPGRGSNPSFDLEDPECGICFESIRKKGERFGILESCDHAFCLTCIRSWRKQREQQDRHNLRLCPVCRNESFFIVPSSDVFLDPEEKRKAIEQYKVEMTRIPCKLFDYGRGSCPFGSSCFYAHLNPDGTRYVPPPLRWRQGADGSEVIGEVKLSDFLVRSLALP